MRWFVILILISVNKFITWNLTKQKILLAHNDWYIKRDVARTRLYVYSVSNKNGISTKVSEKTIPLYLVTKSTHCFRIIQLSAFRHFVSEINKCTKTIKTHSSNQLVLMDIIKKYKISYRTFHAITCELWSLKLKAHCRHL